MSRKTTVINITTTAMQLITINLAADEQSSSFSLLGMVASWMLHHNRLFNNVTGYWPRFCTWELLRQFMILQNINCLSYFKTVCYLEFPATSKPVSKSILPRNQVVRKSGESLPMFSHSMFSGNSMCYLL